ncbi:MAG: hypothetical protein ACFFCE_16720 [Promethearchaeota archaeon]
MSEYIPPSKENLEEALQLAETIIKNIELSELELSVIILKVQRLSRLLNDFQMVEIFGYEASGYPTNPEGVPDDIWKLGLIAKRRYKTKDENSEELKEYMYLESIENLEFQVKSFQIAMNSARDPDVSVSSANPRQMVWSPLGNKSERISIRNSTLRAKGRLAERRAFVYNYTLDNYTELKYSKISEDIFSRVRIKVDRRIGELLPDSVKRFLAIYENLKTENPEDWSNAVHSCRRILEDLADAIFSPDEDRILEVNGEEKQIKLDKDHYINRIITFISDHSESKSFNNLIGSNLYFIADRLESVLKASHKGTHDTIFSKEEADRYVIYTYLIVGDILSLTEEESEE